MGDKSVSEVESSPRKARERGHFHLQAPPAPVAPRLLGGVVGGQDYPCRCVSHLQSGRVSTGTLAQLVEEVGSEPRTAGSKPTPAASSGGDPSSPFHLRYTSLLLLSTEVPEIIPAAAGEPADELRPSLQKRPVMTPTYSPLGDAESFLNAPGRCPHSWTFSK